MIVDRPRAVVVVQRSTVQHNVAELPEPAFGHSPVSATLLAIMCDVDGCHARACGSLECCCARFPANGTFALFGAHIVAAHEAVITRCNCRAQRLKHSTQDGIGHRYCYALTSCTGRGAVKRQAALLSPAQDERDGDRTDAGGLA